MTLNSNNGEMAKTSLHTHTWLLRAYLALAGLSCYICANCQGRVEGLASPVVVGQSRRAGRT